MTEIPYTVDGTSLGSLQTLYLYSSFNLQGPIYTVDGTSLIRTPMGQKKVSLLVRCPHFRG